MQVTKASGEKEEFSKEKFCGSLEKAGIPSPVVEKTCDFIASEVEEGVSTEEIFYKAREILLKENPIYAGKYSLKQSIMELGPAGYLFEQYFAAVLEEYRYETITNEIMQGKCVTHETDVLAEKEDKHYIIEAKYHNKRGVKSGIQTVLYTHARFLDIKDHQEIQENEKFDHTIWLATNTKVTSQGVDYAKCRDIKLTCWDYPQGESLKELIEAKTLYPTTLLPAVNKFARKQFAKEKIFFAKDLVYFEAEDLETRFDIFPHIAKDIVSQAKSLLESTEQDEG